MMTPGRLAELREWQNWTETETKEVLDEVERLRALLAVAGDYNSQVSQENSYMEDALLNLHRWCLAVGLSEADLEMIERGQILDGDGGLLKRGDEKQKT